MGETVSFMFICILPQKKKKKKSREIASPIKERSYKLLWPLIYGHK